MAPDAALTSFGFNQLEATVYHELLRRSPATGYRLAQRIGRAPANIYQVLKSLLQKGAVLEKADAAEATSYVPVPPEQLIASLRSNFMVGTEAALEVLRNVHQAPKQDTLSQLRTASQVIERARSMIRTASQTLIFDMVPELFDLFSPELREAQERGLNLVGIAYRPNDASATMPFKGEPVGTVRKRWPGLGIILVADACEQLVAQVSEDLTDVLNAVYSDSPFLSCIMHGLLQADIRLVALRGETPDAVPESPLDAFTLQAARPPGLRAMMRD